MKHFLIAAAVLLASTLSVMAEPGGHHVHGAPGPIVGAGLPVLAIGYGVFWLIKRRRKAN